MHLGSDESVEAGELIPVRMLNEFSYCPRLFYLEFVQGEFVDNAFTVEGRAVHRRVDAKATRIEAPESDRPFEARSVSLSSERLGLTAKIDLVEGEGGAVIPVDYKRGAVPENPERSHEPERVQICAYGLLLRENGYACDRGVLYFAQSKTRVEIPFDESLVTLTLKRLEEAKALARGGQIPPPLKASPKCQGCSLNGICLPDEVELLAKQQEDQAGSTLRGLVPSRDDAVPLYVTEQGARVGISGEVIEVRGREGTKTGQARLFELSQLVLWGNVSVSAQAARELLVRGVPICWLTWGGWLAGLSDGMGHGNIELRRAQFRAAESPERSLSLARRFVRVKILNARTLLRRNHPEPPEHGLREMAQLAERASAANGLPELLGLEGNAARIYFEGFPRLLKPGAGAEAAFDFQTRNRRPPKDPVNALLSLAYALLARDVAVTCRLVGLDPFLGFYHQPRYGRPALALDVMEEFRPIIADSVVLNAVNTRVVGPEDFVRSGLGVALKPEGRKNFLRAYERRMTEEITHPVFGYRVSYRRILEVQVRLLARHLLGEIETYPDFRTR